MSTSSYVRLCAATGIVATAGLLAATSAFGGDSCQSSNKNYASSCQAAEPVMLGSYGSDANIVETAKEAGQFNTLLKAAKAAGLAGTLSSDGPFTVFAPTDGAFGKLPTGTIDTLLKPENKDQLAAILTYHVLPGKFTASDVLRLGGAETVNGQRVDFSTSGNGVMIEGARIVSTDVMASNGVIHVIDSVIMPAQDDIIATAQSAGQFGTLLAAAEAAGLVEALQGEGPLTVLAPTDAAFAKLPAGTVEKLLRPESKNALAMILKYHVIPGRNYATAAAGAREVETLQGGSVFFGIRDGQLYVDNAKIVATDIDASNGVIHVIDTVIIPTTPSE